MSSSVSAMERTNNAASASTGVSGDVMAVLSAAVAGITGNDTGSDSAAAGGDSDGRDTDGCLTNGKVQPSHSQVAGQAEARRQQVVDLARKRVGSSATKNTAAASPPVPATVICTEAEEEAEENSSSDVGNDDSIQEERETMASLLPLSSKDRVERSIEEIKAKMMMIQEDSDHDDKEEKDEKEDEEGKQQKLDSIHRACESEVRISVTSNNRPSDADDITRASTISSTKNQSKKKKKKKKKKPSPGLTIDIPFDERPQDLPDDVPSFDAGEDWEGWSRRPASPPALLPPVSPRLAAAAPKPPAAPTNATSRDKHFFGKEKNKKSGAALAAPRQPPDMPPKPDYDAPEVPNAQSTSYEDSDADDGAASCSLSRSKLPPSAKDVNEDVTASVARARAAGLATNDDDVTERQSKGRSSSTASSSSSSRRCNRSLSRSRSFRRKGRTNVSRDYEDEQYEHSTSSRRHHTSRNSRKRHAEKLRKRPETTISEGGQTRSTASFAETTSHHGIGGSKGILEACDPLRSNSPKSSLILEFEDQDLIGWIMSGEACTSLQKCGGTDRDIVHSHHVEQVTSDDDDMSDISNLTGKWRRSRLLVEEQQRRKAEEEAKRHNSSPFDFMSMFCGDLKALFCDGLKPDAASF